MFWTLFTLAVSLTVSNFLWQIITRDHDWGTAVERSYFQACALLIAWMALK